MQKRLIPVETTWWDKLIIQKVDHNKLS